MRYYYPIIGLKSLLMLKYLRILRYVINAM